MIKSLRDLICIFEKYGELIRIVDFVDWNYEIGDRTRKSHLSDSAGPALLFENIKSYAGFTVMTNGLGSYSRIAITLGKEPTTSFKEIVNVFKDRVANPVPPVLVEKGPIQENILIGDNVNLLKLPVPWWNREDAGRYIGTWHLNITKDPETRIRNIGIYRMQLLDSRKTAVSISPRSHLALHLSKAEKKGIPLEMAAAIGVDETLIMAGAAAVPFGVDEYHIAGRLRQAPVELIKCRTVDIEVPASAEIVLEGKILPEIRINEGPFLDYSGIPKGDPNALVFEVTCMMYRNNPIFRGAAIGAPGAEDHLLYSLLSDANCLDFHGSRIRQLMQNYLFKKGFFRTSQLAGMFRHLLVSGKKITGNTTGKAFLF